MGTAGGWLRPIWRLAGAALFVLVGGCAQTLTTIDGVESVQVVHGPALLITREPQPSGISGDDRWVLADEETASLTQARVGVGGWFYVRRGMRLPVSYRVDRIEADLVQLTVRDYVRERQRCHCMRARHWSARMAPYDRSRVR